MRKIMRALRVAGVVLTSAAMTLSGSIALASPTSQFSQVINAGTLSTDIRVQEPKYERIANGQLRVKMLVRNLRDWDLNVDYQYRFVDKAGLEVDSPTGWHHQRIPRKGVAQVEFTSITPAEDFRVEFRHAR